jgi:hypothetical protein
MSLARDIPHILLHTIEIIKGIREKVEVALDVTNQVALHYLQITTHRHI